jgi:hypothetical protein
MLLIRENAWKYIEDARPTDPSNEWKEGDLKAQSTISLSIDDNQIINVYKCKSSKEMWEELQKVHERVNLSTKLFLLRKLYQSKLGSNQDMQNYIRMVLELVERLMGIGEEIKEFYIAALFLSGLPNEYDTLVTTR